jgi:hypothetical protein
MIGAFSPSESEIFVNPDNTAYATASNTEMSWSSWCFAATSRSLDTLAADAYATGGLLVSFVRDAVPVVSHSVR